MRKADNIKLTLEGHTFVSAEKTNDPRTSIRSDHYDKQGKLVEENREYKALPVASWTAAAYESAVYHAQAHGHVVVKGVTIADKVQDRNAYVQAEEWRLEIVENQPRAARPQTASEAAAEKQAEKVAKVAEMQADDDVSQDDIIAFLLNG